MCEDEAKAIDLGPKVKETCSAGSSLKHLFIVWGSF